MSQQRSRSVLFWIDLLAAAAAILCIVWVLFSTLLPAGNPEPSTAAAANAAVQRPQYCASVSENRVIIRLMGQSDPILVTDIDVRTLPPADQTALSEGILLDGMEAVQQLIEDYSG